MYVNGIALSTPTAPRDIPSTSSSVRQTERVGGGFPFPSKKIFTPVRGEVHGGSLIPADRMVLGMFTCYHNFLKKN